MENIRMIDIELIHQHPDNPRKDIGDVTELAESIKQQGIMQNLTVVPFVSKFNSNFNGEGMFTVIIGHRRLAAAKLAGLREVPCVVVEMTEKEQLAVMLSENMQRVDLTPVEEAMGVQMLLDLGDSVKDISKLTGFSESKVRQRAKMSQLPREAFLTSQGGSIQDYIKITEIEDEGKRKALLKKLGTADFNLEYNRAISAQKAEKRRAKWTEILESFAYKITDTSSKKYVTSIYPDSSDPDKYNIPEDSDDVRYYYEQRLYYIRLYIDYTADELEEKAQKQKDSAREQAAKDAKRSRLNHLEEEFERLRTDFVKEYTGEKAHAYDLTEFIVNYLIDCDVWHNFKGNQYEFQELLGFGRSEKDIRKTEAYRRILIRQPQRILLCFIVAQLKKEMQTPVAWDCTFIEDETRDSYFKVLKRCGYEMAEEEKRFYDGTHEAYEKEEE